MNPSVDIDKGQVGEFSRRILEALPDLRGECVQNVREALPDSVRVAVANLGKLARRSRHKVGRSRFLTKQAHFAEELARVEVADNHFLIWRFAVVNDHRR